MTTQRAVHQLLPVFAYGDAVGGTVLQLRSMLRNLGFRSEIYADLIDDRLHSEAQHSSALERDPPSTEDALLYHLSIGSPVVRTWERTPARRLLFYANITPPHYYRGINARITHLLSEGVRDFLRIAPRSELVLTHSTFSLEEALQAGAPTGAVVPACDFSRLGGGESQPEQPPYVLYVGRAAPNKRLQDLVRALAALRTTLPGARLVLAGSAHDCESYADALRALAAELQVTDAVEFPGELRRTDEEIDALYRGAAVYASASEHEGFCVPLLEAMAHRVPIVARAATAVPETVGQAGLLLHSDDPLVWAAALQRALTDAQLRRALMDAGTEQLQRFRPEAVQRRLQAALHTAGLL